jgi:hypothetical protein
VPSEKKISHSSMLYKKSHAEEQATDRKFRSRINAFLDSVGVLWLAGSEEECDEKQP